MGFEPSGDALGTVGMVGEGRYEQGVLMVRG